jgi:hypothetical protein
VKIVRQPITGIVLVDGEKAALRIDREESSAIVYLTYALVTQGPEYQIIPSVLLDDWGNEITGLKIYEWIRENGQSFTRAEVFGFSPSGAEVQYFLRDIELFGRYPAYVLSGEGDSIVAGTLLRAVLIPDHRTGFAEKIPVPEEVEAPLREAQVEWWRVGPQQNDLEFIV